MNDLIRKLTSRKFWICVAAFLGSIATSIAGIQNGMEKLAMVGILCGMGSAAIYAACEAAVDASNVDVTLYSEEEDE
ncbi:MAG: hypothetical protein LIO96_14960 [Lachnospiraceae bacterium]|nr:hypothetical protein [Lachnospiraceae bacterium]